MSDRFGIILAAGFGTRMLPLTKVTPKPLLPFLNTPIIAYTVDHMVRAGIRHIGVNLHHLGHLVPPFLEQLAQALKPSYGHLEFTCVEEQDIRGTAGGVAGVWSAMGCPQGTAAIINGDALTGMNLGQALDEHQVSGARATLVTRPASGGHPGGVWATSDAKVVGLRKAGVSSGIELDFMGIHFVEGPTLEAARTASEKAQTTCMVGDVYIPSLGTPAAPRTIINEDFWIALDNPSLLLHATRAVLENPSIFPQAPLVENKGAGMTFMNSKGVNDKAMVSPPVFAGLDVHIDAGTRVGPNVVMDGVHALPTTVLRGAVMYGMGRVEGEWASCVCVNGEIAQVTPGT